MASRKKEFGLNQTQNIRDGYWEVGVSGSLSDTSRLVLMWFGLFGLGFVMGRAYTIHWQSVPVMLAIGAVMGRGFALGVQRGLATGEGAYFPNWLYWVAPLFGCSALAIGFGIAGFDVFIDGQLNPSLVSLPTLRRTILGLSLSGFGFVGASVYVLRSKRQPASLS